MEFKDRTAEKLNQKILEVEKVERDETGEIVRLYGKEIRDEEEVLEEGTALDAKSLVKAVKKLIEIYHYTDEEKVSYDVERLTLENEVTEDFELVQEGYADTVITWSKISGNGLEIVGGTAKVTRGNEEQTVKLRANVSSNEESATKEFEVKIPAKEKSLKEKLEEDLENLNIQSEITSSLVLPLVGENGSNISWTCNNLGKDGYVTFVSPNKVNVVRDTIDYNIGLIAVLSNESNITKTKTFIVKVLRKDPVYTPTIINKSIVQIKDTLKTVSEVIESTNNEELFIRVENEYSDLVEVVIMNNSSGEVKVYIKETTKLNQMTQNGSLKITINLKVNLASNKEEVIGIIPCNIFYYFPSTEPVD